MPGAPTLDATHVLALLGLLLLPGTGVFVALLPPGRVPLPAAAALAVALGYVSVALGGYLLALLHVLNHGSALAIVAAISVAAWGLGWRRVHDHVRAFGRDVRGSPAPLLIGVAALLAFCVVRLSYEPAMNLAPTTLRYWADGVEMADAGRLPATVLHWDELIPPAKSKVALSSFYAVTSLTLGRSPLPDLGAVLLVLSIAVAMAAWGFLWTLGLRWTAPAAVLWLIGNTVAGQQELSRDLSTALAENWGRLLMFASAGLVIGVLRRTRPRAAGGSGDPPVGDGRRELLVAGVVLGVSSATHLVPTVVAIAICGAYAAARMLFDRTWRGVLVRCALGFGTAVLVGCLLLFLASGDLGFQGVADAKAYEQIRQQYGLPATWDPTAYIANGDLEQDVPAPYGAGDAIRAFATRGISVVPPDHHIPPWGHPAPFVLGATGLLLVVLLGDRERRMVAVAIVVYAAVLLVVAVAFAVRFETFAVARFGERRLIDYWGLPFVVLAAAGLEAAITAWHRRAARGMRPAVSFVLTLFAVWLLLPSAVAPAAKLAAREADLPPLAWLATHVPCEGRILADRRTLATFEVFTGHAGVLEGMGPHLRPDVLDHAIGELFAARGFFLDPAHGEDYLRQHGVAAVVLTGQGGRLAGWSRVAPVQPGKLISTLGKLPFLRLAYSSVDATVFAVRGFQPDPSLPTVAGRPGYRCLAGA